MLGNVIKTAGVVATTLALISCDSGAFVAPAEDGPNQINGVQVASITLDAASLIVEDDTVALHATALDDSGSRIDDPALELEWTSSDERVATISSAGGTDGELISRTPGTTTLTVSYDQISASATIEVHNRPVDLVYVTGSGQEADGGTTLPDSLAVRAVDKRGDAVSGVYLTFSVTAGGGSVSRSAGTTGSDGVLRTAWTLGSSGTQQVRALASSAQPRVKKMQDSVVVFTASVVDTAFNVSSVTVTPDSAVVDPNGTVDLDADVRDNNGRAISANVVAWASSDTTVARVDAQGLVTAVAEGQIVVSATADGVSGTSTVTVAGSSDGTLTISASADTLYGIGDTLTLSVEARDAAGTVIADPNVQWSSSDPDIATVDSMGRLTARAIGTAVIAASAACCSGDFAEVVVAPGAPETVRDLTVAGAGTDSVMLRWTEVDDGTGSAANYALRFDSPTLSWGEAFGSEITVQGSTVDATTTYTVTGLAAGTDYEFGLVSYRGTLEVDAVFGETSNFVATATDGAGGGGTVGEPAYVVASPSSHTFTNIGATRQITATARDNLDQAVPGVDFSFSSTDPSVVSVDSTGIMTARDLGTAAVIVAAIGTGFADTVQAQVDTTAAQPFFSDDFESGDNSHSENGFSWVGGDSRVVTGNAHSGMYAQRYRFGPDALGEDSWEEQRFNFNPGLSEVWIEYMLYIPDNWVHRSDPPSNNKFIYMGGDYNRGLTFLTEYDRVSDTQSRARMLSIADQYTSGGETIRDAANNPIHNTLVASSMRGQWVRVRVHAKVASGPGRYDGVWEGWINDSLAWRSGDWVFWESDGRNEIVEGYLLGWSNSGYSQQTDFYIDDVKVYDHAPRWW